MTFPLRLILLGILISGASTVRAEVFTCKQADGTTVFAHTPCRAEKPASAPVPVIPIYVEPEPEFVEPENLGAAISEIELELDNLRKAREQEIADAPYSTSNPNLLADLKSEIRATYQARIDEKLSKLIELRTRQRQHSGAD